MSAGQDYTKSRFERPPRTIPPDPPPPRPEQLAPEPTPHSAGGNFTTHLHPGRAELESFLATLFRYADEDTFISLRVFDQFDRAVPPVLIRAVQVNGDADAMLDTVAQVAQLAADHPTPTVFAPPVCTFKTNRGAKGADLANGLVLSVEIDEQPNDACGHLQLLLGPATIITASGSDWVDPETGEVQPKLHLHWRLSEPTRDDEEHANLRAARAAATMLVGSDPTGVSVVHPYRWPGSWNTKAQPRMARIIAANADREIHLLDALERLEDAVEATGCDRYANLGGQSADGQPQAPDAWVKSAMAALPNPGTDVHYNDWIRIGYAVANAMAGDPDAFSVWQAWSKQSDKYDAKQTPAAWKRILAAIKGGTQRRVGAGTIFMLAAQHGWQHPDTVPPPVSEEEYGTTSTKPQPAQPSAFRPGWRGPPDPELALPFAKDSKNKIIAKHQNNIRKAIDGCGATLSYDEFADRELIEGPDNRPPRFYGDAEEKALYLRIDSKYGFLPPYPFFQIVANEFSRRHTFHPVRQYLDHVQPTWDRTPRVGDPNTKSWLTTYGGAPDNNHTRAVGRMVLVAAVRRVRHPGAKFDEILTLVTPKQGQNRSTAIEIMAVSEDWFTDSLPIGADDKVVIEQTAGIWIGELADLHGKRGDVNKLKNFASRKRDRARLAYGHKREERPRQFVLIATTNEERPLKDVTGNRRYLMLRIVGFDVKALARDRDQIWAEAATIEATGESIRLATNLYYAAAQQQEAHRERDAWEELLADLLGDMTGKIPTEDLWVAVGKEDPGKRFQDDNARLGAVMRALGWRGSRRRFANLGRRYCYVKGSKDQIEANTINFPRPERRGKRPG